jgi:hypothetical protein
MSDVVKNAKTGITAVNNGAVIVFAQETGEYKKIDPEVNVYVPSGVLISRYDTRFDEHYGGGPS